MLTINNKLISALICVVQVDNKVYTPNLRDNRDGSLTKEKAYNGTNISTFYRTPSQFFVGNGIGDFDPGDTGKTAIGVLDRQGNVRSMVASGKNTFLFPCDHFSQSWLLSPQRLLSQ